MQKVRFTLDPNDPPELSDETVARWDALRDEDTDFSDAPEVDPAFWREVEPHADVLAAYVKAKAKT